jgi:GT2 family glycosyltransferase
VDQVIGAFFFIRRALFENLAGFDERFFVYFEEVDLSLRARQHGCASCFLHEAEATHLGQASSNQIKALRLLFFVRSRILYCKKHMGRGSVTIILLCSVFVEPFVRLGWAAFGYSQSSVRQVLSAYRAIYTSLAGYAWRRMRQFMSVAGQGHA